MNAQYVVFSQRAFNAIVTETLDKDPIETGGIFIGYILDNGAWVVIENIPPGHRSTHRQAFFEYDTDFVNYLSNVVAKQYQGNLQLLGLWHRHPGNMDFFSTTDDETNMKFAQDRECGSISALVNCDPKMRITMYSVGQQGGYTKIPWYVDDGFTIPERMITLRYTTEDDLPIIGRCAQEQRALQSEIPQTIAQQSEHPADIISNDGRKYGLKEGVKEIISIFKRININDNGPEK